MGDGGGDIGRDEDDASAKENWDGTMLAELEPGESASALRRMTRADATFFFLLCLRAAEDRGM